MFSTLSPCSHVADYVIFLGAVVKLLILSLIINILYTHLARNDIVNHYTPVPSDPCIILPNLVRNLRYLHTWQYENKTAARSSAPRTAILNEEKHVRWGLFPRPCKGVYKTRRKRHRRHESQKITRNVCLKTCLRQGSFLLRLQYFVLLKPLWSINSVVLLKYVLYSRSTRNMYKLKNFYSSILLSLV